MGPEIAQIAKSWFSLSSSKICTEGSKYFIVEHFKSAAFEMHPFKHMAPNDEHNLAIREESSLIEDIAKE